MRQPIWFKQLQIGEMQNYVYLLGDPETRDAAVVDAAWDVEAIVQLAQAEGYTITKNLVTHFHPDHLGGSFMSLNIQGAAELAALVPAKTYIHKAELPFIHQLTGLSASDVVAVEGGDEAHVGNFTLKFLHTPGHTPGSQCFLLGNAVLSGDTLFIGSCGRVDLPGSSPEDMHRSLTHVLAALPDKTQLYPGHNYAGLPHSTIGDEKRRSRLLSLPLHEFLEHVGRG